MLGLKSLALGLSVVLSFIAREVFCEEAVTNKLEVKVYYEALCWDSVQFISNKLRRSMTGKARLPYADLKFVPYGKVVMYDDSKTNQTILDCQHGRRECELNALHACIIEKNTEQESYDMITCLMARYTYVPSKCAARYGINLDAAYQCKRTRTVVDILRDYGTDTYAVGLSFVPTITFDGVYDYYEQNDILRNFDGVFCNKYKNKFNVTLEGC